VSVAEVGQQADATELYLDLLKRMDDYFLTGARTAVHDFLEQQGEDPQIHRIDAAGAFWRKESA
jgi:Macrocin-O-methyltransferase (TylF)